MTDLATGTASPSTGGATSGQSGFDFTTLLKDLLNLGGAYTAWNAAGNNDKNVANLVSQLTTKAPPATVTANGGTSTYNNGNMTVDNGVNTGIQSLFRNNAGQALTTANSLNPAVTSAAQGVTDATKKSYGDVYDSTLAAIRGQLADTQTKTWNSLASNLFSTGNLGTTGGANQTQAFMQAAGQNDLAAQLAAQTSATNARTSDINAATTNFNVQNTAQNSQVQQALQELSGSNAIDQNTLSMIQTALNGTIGQTSANNAGAGSAAALLSHTPDTTAQSLLASLLSGASGQNSSGSGLLGDLANGVDSLLGGSGNVNNDITGWLKGLLGGSGSGVSGAGDSLAGDALNGLGSANDAIGNVDGPISGSDFGSSGGSGGSDIGSAAGGASTGYGLYDKLFGGTSSGSTAGATTGGTAATTGGSATSGGASGSATTGSGTGLSTTMAGVPLGAWAGLAYIVGTYLGSTVLGSNSATFTGDSAALAKQGITTVPNAFGNNQSALRSDSAGLEYGMGNNGAQGSANWFYKDSNGAWQWAGQNGTATLNTVANKATDLMSSLSSMQKAGLVKEDATGTTVDYSKAPQSSVLNGTEANNAIKAAGLNVPPTGAKTRPTVNFTTTGMTIAPDGTITKNGYVTVTQDTSGYTGAYKPPSTKTVPYSTSDASFKDAYNTYGKASGSNIMNWLGSLALISGAVSGTSGYFSPAGPGG